MEPICPQCGDVGKTNTFVHCVKCLEFAIHRYCLDKVPESFDEFVHWVCDDCEDKLREKSAARDCNVIIVDSSDSEDVEIIERMSDDALKVETERIFKNLRDQRHDARTKLDSTDAVEADKDCSNEIDESTSLRREERESDQTLEMLEKEVSSVDITLKEFAKIKKNEKRMKNKHRVEEPCNEKDCHALGSDISAKQSHKKPRKVDSRDQAVSPNEKKSSKLYHRMSDDVLKVETGRIFKNLRDQRHDARTKLDSIDAVEADKDCSNEIDESTSLRREERESDQPLEMLEKEVLSVDITLKEFAKIKKNEKRMKNKHRIEEPCNEKDCHALGSDISAKQSHKKHRKVDSRDQAVSPNEKKSSKLRDERRGSKKSHESVNHPSTKRNRVLLSNESSGALKKHKIDPSKKVNLREKIAEKDTVLPIKDNLELILDKRLDEVSDKVVSSDPCNENVGKNTQVNISRRRLMVSDMDAFCEPIPIWCGGLHISTKHHSIHGLVAHISSKARRKVYETAREFRPMIDFEMRPKTEIWPKSFEILEPSLESVALYFFASEVSVLAFDNLVKDMILKELALKAILQDAELLIFASTELPMRYSRFKGKFYLWGVFIGKTLSPSDSNSHGNAIEDKATKSHDTLRENNGIN